MANLPGATTTLEAYQLRLPVFEGPLDVLLRLIEREQLAISEVSLLVVLDQFMAFMQTLESPAPDVVAEFATVAGRLSLLKSRSLLPRPARPPEETDEPDLVRQLEEYRALKAAAELLAVRLQSGSGAYGRGDGVATPSAEPAQFAPLAPQAATALERAVKRWLTRVPPRPELRAIQRVVSLREMIGRIAALIEHERRLPFERVRATCASRQDVAVAFLALLTLVRRQVIAVEQPDLFGTITLAPLPGRSNAPGMAARGIDGHV
jgi:segregation and condensation protein A